MLSTRIQRVFFDNLKSTIAPADKNPKWMGLVTLVVTFALCGAVARA